MKLALGVIETYKSTPNYQNTSEKDKNSVRSSQPRYSKIHVLVLSVIELIDVII